MKESDSDHDLRIDLETEIEEYKPQFVVEAVRQEDVDLEIDYSASHSTHVPLYQQTRPDVPLQLEEPQALPEQEEPQHSDVSPGGSQNSIGDPPTAPVIKPTGTPRDSYMPPAPRC